MKTANEYEALYDLRDDDRKIRKRDPYTESALAKVSVGYMPRTDAQLLGILGDGMPSVFRPSGE